MGQDVSASSSREGVSVCSREHSVDEARKTASTKPVPRRAQPHRRTLRTLAHVEDDRAPQGLRLEPMRTEIERDRFAGVAKELPQLNRGADENPTKVVE